VRKQGMAFFLLGSISPEERNNSSSCAARDFRNRCWVCAQVAALKAKTEGQQQRLAELEAAAAVHADAADRLASAKVSHSPFGLGRSLALPASRRISGDFLEGAERVGLRVGHAYRRLQLFYSGRAHASCYFFLFFFSLCARRRRWRWRCCVCGPHPSPHQASVAQRDALLRSAKDQAAACRTGYRQSFSSKLLTK
jgi:hypothetical protein